MSKKYSVKEVKQIEKYISKWLGYKEIAKKSWLTDYLAKEAVRKWKNWTLVPVRPPKILLLDIETAPLEVYTWGLWDQKISIDQIKEDWFMLCWSAKWLFDSKVYSDTLTPSEALKKDDSRISKSIWKMVDEADIIIAHNWDSFDIKKMNVRFIKHWMLMPSPYITIDTLKVAKKVFKMTSNKLNYLCRFLWLNVKVDTGWFELWRKCILWDKKSLRLMSEYCDNDVRILEDLYMRLRPYINNHPNLNLYSNSEDWVCRNCWSEKIKWWKKYHTPHSHYKAGQCQECWAWVRKEVINTSKIK